MASYGMVARIVPARGAVEYGLGTCRYKSTVKSTPADDRPFRKMLWRVASMVDTRS